MDQYAPMNLNYQILLDSIGLVQGTTIGILLIILNRRKYRSTFFLGLFLILYSLELATWIFKNTNIEDVNTKLFLLPFNFSWLLFPLFFLYTQKVSILPYKKIKYWILYPGIVSFLAQLIIFLLPFETKQEIDKSDWHVTVFWILGNYYSWIIGIWNLRLLYQHGIEARNTFSYLAFKELRWARNFLFYLLVTSVFGHIIAYAFPTSIKDNTIFSIMDLIAIYWVSYFGIVQHNVLSTLSKKNSLDNSQNITIDEESLPTEITERLEELMENINNHMTLSECFINPELTIIDLAEELKVHPKLVSKAINNLSEQNFNSFVNLFRIEKAKPLLKNQQNGNLSIEGIGNTVGFNSKSAFYSAFKKNTGTTPTRFIEMTRNNNQ